MEHDDDGQIMGPRFNQWGTDKSKVYSVKGNRDPQAVQQVIKKIKNVELLVVDPLWEDDNVEQWVKIAKEHNLILIGTNVFPNSEAPIVYANSSTIIHIEREYPRSSTRVIRLLLSGRKKGKKMRMGFFDEIRFLDIDGVVDVYMHRVGELSSPKSNIFYKPMTKTE
jgi:hypothetical protein